MHVKLYNLDHSPYATRVRMQIYKKGLDLEILPAPAALRTPEFMARFPMGKIPVLELDDGRQVPDSWVIMEYLEDCQAGESLRPQDPYEQQRKNTATYGALAGVLLCGLALLALAALVIPDILLILVVMAGVVVIGIVQYRWWNNISHEVTSGQITAPEKRKRSSIKAMRERAFEAR